MNGSLDKYVERFSRLNVGRVGNHERPHKPVMLLALLDLFGQGVVKTNQITWSPDLLELFSEYFKAVGAKNDQASPINPFFYLRSEGFWHHHPHPSQEVLLKALKNPPGIRALQEISDYVFLDDELFCLLQDPVARAALRSALITRYFADKSETIGRIADREAEISRYQEQIEDATRVKEDVPEAVRTTAFSRMVRRAYDYRCAACGLRVIMEGGLYIVDAAHLIPFCETRDDDLCNGMALCKNHHWAMDRSLIAPGVDSKWHVSSVLDDRMEGQRDLIQLNGRTVLVPTESRFRPRKDSLHWRERHLLR